MVSRNATRTATVHAVALVALLSAACGQAASSPPDFTVRGIGVLVRSDAPFTTQPDLAYRIESTLGASLAYWGGSFEQVAGMTVTLDGARYVECGGVPGAIGCYDGDIRVSTGDLGSAHACVEQTALVHEVGHAVIGDREHADPRWMDFEAVAAALDGRSGYDGETLTDCRVALSVWRHPPHRR
jgi:hypothetical protein